MITPKSWRGRRHFHVVHPTSLSEKENSNITLQLYLSVPYIKLEYLVEIGYADPFLLKNMSILEPKVIKEKKEPTRIQIGQEHCPQKIQQNMHYSCMFTHV